MTISDAHFEQIQKHEPRVTYRPIIDNEQKQRLGYTFLAISLMAPMLTHCSWGMSYPTVEDLAVAQDMPINPEAGPTETIDKIYELLPKAMFTPDGQLDIRVTGLLKANGFRVVRALSRYDDDCYTVNTRRGSFIVYPPAES